MASNSDIRWAVRDIVARAPKIALYRAYYDGAHRLPWSTPKWQSEFMELFARFRDNLCPAIIDAKADRIQLDSIGAGTDDALNNAIDSIWQREKLERRQGEITKNGLKDGDAFVIVWPDALNQARWFVQRGDRIAVEYKDEPQGEIEKAAKLWPSDEYSAADPNQKSTWRVNIYYEDRIERYVTQNAVPSTEIPTDVAKWDEYVVSAADNEDIGIETGPVIANPYGRVPVFPFPNNADLGTYGRSELKDIIPIQDALNKSVANMLVGGEFVAWPQRYIIGIEVDVDEQGEPTGREQRSALDRIMAIGNPNATAGQFDGADLTKFIAEQDSYRAEMARISRTPLHYLLLSGNFPSGEALAAAERPLMSQVDDRIGELKPRYSEAMSFSLMVEKVDHQLGLIQPIFKDTRFKDPKSEADALRLKKELGVPDEEIWREMGYDKAQIEEFKMAKLERTVAMQAAFDAGGPGVNPMATTGTPAAPFTGG